jgi:signal transduction histidine kinase/CheY-like chemotaxis protein
MPVPSRPRSLSNWLFPTVIVLLAALPLALFAVTAWNERERTLQVAERTAERTVVALHEHTLKVLETHELILGGVDHQIRGRSWSEIEQDEELWNTLIRVGRRFESVTAINLVDSAGRVRMTTTVYPAPLTMAADLDGYQAQRDGAAGTYIGVRDTDGGRLITLSQRRSTVDEGFDGIIHIAVPVSLFTTFWEQFTPTVAHVVPLVRADGLVIARYPAPDNPDYLDVSGPFLSRALVQPRGTYTAHSLVDGVERLNVYAQIRDYPLFISFSIETRAILAQWREGLILYGLYAVLAAAALAGGAGVAMRRYQAQLAAVQRWQDTADQLASEMARRESIEASLRQSQKMESIGQLTGGIAHDFNNLLMVVIGNLELIGKRLPPDDARLTRLVENALEGARRGTALTQRLLAYARRQDLKPEAVGIPELVQGMRDLLERSLGPQVRIETRFESEIPKVLVDANQLELAILNLAVNARDAMPDGGVLTIEVEKQSIREGADVSPGDYVAMRLTDTGSGMDEETLRHAIEPFFSTKDPGQGTGLGLSMVHGLAAQSNGQFSLRSKPGQGTTAEILLPVATTEAGSGSRPPQSAPVDRRTNTKRLTVLLVDDDLLVLMGTRAMLEDLGHDPIEATSGQEALEILDSHSNIDVVVTDQAMPGMTGLQLADAIRVQRPELPIVLVSGYAEVPDSVANTITARLNKPFLQEELSVILNSAIEGGDPPPD